MFMALGIKEINKGKCIDISSEGKGIVKASNMVIMVDNLLLGEEADIQITYKRAGIFYGKMQEVFDSDYGVDVGVACCSFHSLRQLPSR